MRLASTFLLGAVMLSFGVEQAGARPPWWATKLGRYKHRVEAAYAAAASAAAAAQAAAAAAAAQQAAAQQAAGNSGLAGGTLTLSSIVVSNNNLTTIANGGLSYAGGSSITRVNSGTLTVTNTYTALYNNGQAVGTINLGSNSLPTLKDFSGTLIIGPLGLTFNAASSLVTLNQSTVTDMGPGNLTALGGSGVITGSLALNGTTGGTLNLSGPIDGTLTSDSFAGSGTTVSGATLVLSGNLNSALLTLSDGSSFQLGPVYSTASSGTP